jgi:hypothetical protein
MKRKICPICDLPVNEMNYCTHCKKMIRRPILWDVNYYLNEKRPDNEAPHDRGNNPNFNPVPPRTAVPPHTGAPQRTVTANRTATSPNTPVPPRTAAPSPQQPQTRTYIPGSTSGKEQKTPGKKFQISLAGLATLAFVIVGAAPNVIKKADRILDSYNNYEMAAPFDDSGFTQLEEDDVIASGIPCEGYSHFPVDGKAIADAMGQFVNENNYGYQIKPEDVYSDNYELELDDGWVSYYETIIGYYLEDEKTSQLKPEDEGYVYQYVEVNYDTATGEMHDYLSSMNNEEACLAYLEHFLKLTETAASVPLEESSIPSLIEGIRVGLDQENVVDLTEGIFNVTVYREEDMVRVAVSYNDFQSAENGEV